MRISDLEIKQTSGITFRVLFQNWFKVASVSQTNKGLAVWGLTLNGSTPYLFTCERLEQVIPGFIKRKPQAMLVGDLSGQQRGIFTAAFEAGLKTAALIGYQDKGDSDAAVRYEFDDGSAIVTAGVAPGDYWDYGVHVEKIEDAMARYVPNYLFGDDPLPPEAIAKLLPFAWVDAAEGLTQMDARPESWPTDAQPEGVMD